MSPEPFQISRGLNRSCGPEEQGRIVYYRSLNSYLLETFGEKVYKLALDGGFSCPNRDGTIGYGGCSFCAGGSGSFAESVGEDVCSAVERAKARVAGKTSARKFIAYYQSYTGTYAPLSRLERLYGATVEHPDVAVLSVGTRPDCLPRKTVALLSRLNRIKPVWVELGLQTIHEETAARVRRGYGLACYDDAVKRLKDAGLYVVTHLILGLPGESSRQMEDSAAYVGASGSDGIKLQLLHVLRGTELEAQWRRGEVPLPTLEEYVRLLQDCVLCLPEDMTIHRLTGDGDKRLLLAPAWSADKKNVLRVISRGLQPRKAYEK